MPEPGQLICGDAVSVLKQFPDSCVDLLIADPPYNLGKDYGNASDAQSWDEYAAFTRAWTREARRVLRPTGSLYIFMGVRFIARLFMILEDELGLSFNNWITWHYTQGMGRKTGYSPRHEDILFFNRGSDYIFNLDEIRIPQKYFRRRNNMAGANPGDVWQVSHVHYSNPEREPHPTQKPEALMERMIRASTHPGQLVLDPFVGSGTTCRVAGLLGRNWIGIDLNPAYIAMAERRLAMPAEGLDSVDPRLSRVPRDLPC